MRGTPTREPQQSPHAPRSARWSSGVDTAACRTSDASCGQQARSDPGVPGVPVCPCVLGMPGRPGVSGNRGMVCPECPTSTTHPALPGCSAVGRGQPSRKTGQAQCARLVFSNIPRIRAWQHRACPPICEHARPRPRARGWKGRTWPRSGPSPELGMSTARSAADQHGHVARLRHGWLVGVEQVYIHCRGHSAMR